MSLWISIGAALAFAGFAGFAAWLIVDARRIDRKSKDLLNEARALKSEIERFRKNLDGGK